MLQESVFVQKANNPVRNIVESPRIQKLIKASKNAEKPMIPLSIGDPTIFKNLKTPQFFVEALCDAVKDFSNHGYCPSNGKLETRAAIASGNSYKHNTLSPEDVVMASGCSGALEILFRALLNPASEGPKRKILIPSPGFALYDTLLSGLDIPFERYNLLEEKNWECDLEDIERKVDKDTVAILVNNPSNPCGAVYSKAHLQDVMRIAKKKNLIIVADEIYGEITFTPHVFHPMAKLAETDELNAAITTVGGLAKEFLVPGFRIGWIMFYTNSNESLQVARTGAAKLSQLIMGANSIVQAAIPTLFARNDEVSAFKKELASTLKEHAHFVCNRLNEIRNKEGKRVFKVNMSQGSMYALVKLVEESDEKHIMPSGNDSSSTLSMSSDEEETKKDNSNRHFEGGSLVFMEMLLQEEQVFVLPGKVFGPNSDNFFRMTLTPPMDILQSACSRMENFAKNHM